MDKNGPLFLSLSRQYLTASYLAKLERVLASVSDEDIWWRPNEASNSIGNLLLHLTGSTHYWIVSVVGQAPSDRVRQEEFDAVTGGSGKALLDGLRSAVAQADEVLARLAAENLPEMRQTGDKTVTVLEAVYHCVEHFSMHTGQILQLVKLRTGMDLRLSE